MAASAGMLAATLGGAARAQSGPASGAVGPGTPVFAVAPLDVDQLGQDGFELGARARVLYDSNQLRLPDGAAAPAGRSKDDVLTTLVAIVRAQTSPGLQRIFVRAEVGRDYRQKNDFLVNTRVGVAGGWDWRLGTRCSGRIGGGYSQSQADPAEQAAIVANRSEQINVSAGGGCEIGLGLTPTAEVIRRESDNSSPFRRGADVEANAFRAGLAYNRTGKAGVALGFRDERFLYPNRLDPDTGRPIAANRTAAGARVDARIAARTRVAVLVDYNRIEPRGRNRTFREFSGGFTATYQPIPRLLATVALLREVDAAIFAAASYVRRDRAELGAVYSVSPRTRLALRAGVERNRFRDRRGTAGVDVRTVDRTLVFEAAADYRIRRGLYVRLEARGDDRVTDGAFGSFSGTRVGASLRVAI